MKNKKIWMSALALVVIAAVVVSVVIATSSGTKKKAVAASCSSLTASVLTSDGFHVTGPKVMPYDYNNVNANPANALGTTLDFGKNALVIACVSPSDIAKLSVMAQGSGHSTMTADEYMAYLVQQSAGAMVKTPVGGVDDYLDFGNGAEDGLGSTATAKSVRLDAWVTHKYIILTFIAPASVTPSQALLNLISTTQSLFK